MLLSSRTNHEVTVQEYMASDVLGLPPVGAKITNGQGSCFTVVRHADVVLSWPKFYKDFGTCAIVVASGTGYEFRLEKSAFTSGRWQELS